MKYLVRTLACSQQKSSCMYMCRKRLLACIVFLIIIISSAVLAHGEQGLRLPSINDAIMQQHLAGKNQIVISSGSYVTTGSVMLDDRFAGKEIVASGEVIITSSLGGPVFHVSGATNVLVKGFTLKSFKPEDPSNPIAFFLGDQAVEKNRSIAIKVTDSENINIINNDISGYWKGILITSVKSPCCNILVQSNRVSDCGYWSIAAYSRMNGSKSEEKLIGIKFENNYITRSEQGPVFNGVRSSVMVANEVTGNIIGIRLEQSSMNVIKANVIYRNLKAGIWIYNGSYENHIIANKIYDNNLQISRLVRIAKKHGLDPNYLPGDLSCFERTSKVDHIAYMTKIRDRNSSLELNSDFWPYPTAYEHVTPGSRFGHASNTDLKKYWGMYFCQWSGVGIELRNSASKNTIAENEIYNSSPLSMDIGYMTYGIRISQLGLVDAEKYASRENVIRNNKIQNMVKGTILDDNVTRQIKAGNIY